jgi:uncharacterized protein YecE (DUF72 family)
LSGTNAGRLEGFIFSVKIPQVIAHEKVLECYTDLAEFLKTMDFQSAAARK